MYKKFKDVYTMHSVEKALSWLNENYPGDIEDFEMSALDYLAENLDIDINTILEGLNEDQSKTLRSLFSMAFMFDWMDEEDRHFDDYMEEATDLSDDERNFLQALRFHSAFSVYQVVDSNTVRDLFTDKDVKADAAVYALQPGQYFMTHIYEGLIAGPCVPVSDVSWVELAQSEMAKTIDDKDAIEEIGINPDLPSETKRVHLLKLSASQMIITWLSTQMPSFMMDDLFSFMAPEGEEFVVCHRQFQFKDNAIKSILEALVQHDQIVEESEAGRSFLLLKDPAQESDKDNLIANITVMDDAVVVMALSAQRDQTSAEIVRSLLAKFITEETSEQRSVDETMQMMLNNLDEAEPLLKKASIH